MLVNLVKVPVPYLTLFDSGLLAYRTVSTTAYRFYEYEPFPTNTGGLYEPRG
jgi:hypothetical protein